MPTTGLTLPFISSGRSSLVVYMVGTGILLSVGHMRGKPEKRAGRVDRHGARRLSQCETTRPLPAFLGMRGRRSGGSGMPVIPRYRGGW
ncbi:MAG: FtsW/RodA/SpoVE family cell cycle protein [Gemmatimonadales bacterium]